MLCILSDYKSWKLVTTCLLNLMDEFCIVVELYNLEYVIIVFVSLETLVFKMRLSIETFVMLFNNECEYHKEFCYIATKNVMQCL